MGRQWQRRSTVNLPRGGVITLRQQGHGSHRFREPSGATVEVSTHLNHEVANEEGSGVQAVGSQDPRLQKVEEPQHRDVSRCNEGGRGRGSASCAESSAASILRGSRGLRTGTPGIGPGGGSSDSGDFAAQLPYGWKWLATAAMLRARSGRARAAAERHRRRDARLLGR